MALVITLILLAVITTLAVAFLALTSRETGAVDAMGRTTDSELAAQSGLERVKAQVVAPFPYFNQGNDFGSQIMGPDFTVSVAWETNRIDDPGTPFNELTNLLRDPSPPVFVDTNRSGTSGPGEDRFHLDLNRNTLFEPTGHVPATTDNPANNGWGFDFERQNGQIVTNWLVGDPQWIGILQDPTRPHGPDNRFIARYAFLIQPIGRSLDVNWMHNQALDRSPLNLDMQPGGFNGYYRNQGVGSWEINLAGFLADLNANYWNDPATGVYGFDPLNFGPQGAARATSAAFIDAREILRYRYSPRPWNLLAPPGSANRFNDTVDSLLPGSGFVFTNDLVDGYTDGPFSFGPVDESGSGPLPDDPTRPWPGADSRRHFSSIHDLFDGNKLTDPLGFTNKLGQASARGNSYDRYTYYRMLAQMGTESAEEDEDVGKININYVNTQSWLPGSNYRLTSRDMVSWTNSTQQFIDNMGRPGPELFFLMAATNMFAREPALAFIVTNRFDGTPLSIPVYTNRAMGIPSQASTMTTNAPYQGPGVPGPLYAGRIHQILQLAANIHDATTAAKTNEAYPYFSSVFRPQFMGLPNGDVYITNYVLAGPASTVISTNQRWLDLDLGDRVTRPDDLVYGIPFVIGARKGMPNFNEVVMHTEARFVRRLSIRRDRVGGSLVETNQQLELTITNHFAVEARNGYAAAAYPRRLQLSVGIRPTYMLSNSIPSSAFTLPPTNPISGGLIFPPRSWRKTSDKEYQSALLSTSNQFVLKWVTNSAPDPGGFTNFWALAVTNHFLFFLVDSEYDRILDAVSLNGPRSLFEIGKELPKDLDLPTGIEDKQFLTEIWSTKVDSSKGTSSGVRNQIFISMTKDYVPPLLWDNYSEQALNKDGGIEGFNEWLSNSNHTDLVRQVPFTPVRVIIQTNFLAVNDPFVHYTEEDLALTSAAYTASKRAESVPAFTPGRNPKSTTWNNGDTSASVETAGNGDVNPTLRDPGITVLDRWDFPTSTFASLGWLGRVHRGTPWQTVYLKSKGPTEPWKTHSGPSRTDASANSMQPTRDWGLFDVFTAAIHPNASRGRLSVNQTNLAAWSAVLSGVVVGRAGIDEGDGTTVVATNDVIAPAALDNSIVAIVDGINRARTNAPVGRQSGQFFRMGDVLSVPELTFRSPYLQGTRFNADAPTGVDEQIFDADYERIPQQILSLLKRGEPRFVVYVWGQSLKPARNGVVLDGQNRPMLQGPSIVTAGDDKGLCINYQITGETATKSVIRVDFDRLNDRRLNYTRPHAVVESFNVVPNE